MTKKFPHLPHWQLLEGVYRACDGSGWRAVAASELGVPKSQLRTIYGRPLIGYELDALHAKLKISADSYRSSIDREVLAGVAAAKAAVCDAQVERQEELRRQAVAEKEKRDAEEWRNSAACGFELSFMADLLED
ncbi:MULTISPECIES: hypothetical protein [Bradyrhizobium]|uniref:hypothetical protein n=1 Tax=Bradyrhizobium TaxID=374 RepID=UPI001EDB9E8F|nr:hypothetical protein [Bradyrhizobium zhengyangense]MCG2645708.1 hypothetical protein [Bradyrhizobium zhengyangense]